MWPRVKGFDCGAVGQTARRLATGAPGGLPTRRRLPACPTQGPVHAVAGTSVLVSRPLTDVLILPTVRTTARPDSPSGEAPRSPLNGTARGAVWEARRNGPLRRRCG